MLPEIKKNVPLASLTTLGVGGEAEYFTVAKSEGDLVLLVNFAKENNLTITVLGGGSNVIVKDEGVNGLLIKNEIKGISGEILVTAGAGEEWDDFVQYTVDKGWWGLENLSGIPGTVGATPIQNVGAYGAEVSNVIDNVKVYSTQEEQFKNLTAAECLFGYRDSLFKSEAGQGLIVVSVTYRLNEKANPALHYKDLVNVFGTSAQPSQQDIRQAVIEIRSKKFPNWRELGTAGSFFKNPIISSDHFARLIESYPELPGFTETDGRVKVSLGWILDKVCNLKGVKQGNVGTYLGQSLVLVNYGNATAKEIISFSDDVIKVVKEKTDIQIEREPVLI